MPRRAIDLSMSSSEDDAPPAHHHRPTSSSSSNNIDSQLSFPEDSQDLEIPTTTSSRHRPYFRTVRLSHQKKQRTTAAAKKTTQKRPSSNTKTPALQSIHSHANTKPPRSQSPHDSPNRVKKRPPKAHVLAARQQKDSDDSSSSDDDDDDHDSLSDTQLSQPLDHFRQRHSTASNTRQSKTTKRHAPQSTQTRRTTAAGKKKQPNHHQSSTLQLSSSSSDDDEVQIVDQPRTRRAGIAAKSLGPRRSNKKTRQEQQQEEEAPPVVKPLRRRRRQQQSNNNSNHQHTNSVSQRNQAHHSRAHESSSSSSSDEAPDTRPKDILKAGDFISYYNPVFVAGNPDGFRQTIITKIANPPEEEEEEDDDYDNEEDATANRRRRRRRRRQQEDWWCPLTLANGEVLPSDTRVTRLLTNRVREIQEFTLLPGKIQSGTIVTRQDRLRQLVQSVRHTAAHIPKHLQELKSLQKQPTQQEETIQEEQHSDNDITVNHDTDEEHDTTTTNLLLRSKTTPPPAHSPQSFVNLAPHSTAASSSSSPKPVLNNLPFSLSAASSQKQRNTPAVGMNDNIDNDDDDSEVATVIPTPFSAPSATRGGSSRRQSHQKQQRSTKNYGSGGVVVPSTQKTRPIRLFQQQQAGTTPKESSLGVLDEEEKVPGPTNSLGHDRQKDSRQSQNDNDDDDDSSLTVLGTVSASLANQSLHPPGSVKGQEEVCTKSPSSTSPQKVSTLQSPRAREQTDDIDTPNSNNPKDGRSRSYSLSSSQSSQSLEALLKHIQPKKKATHKALDLKNNPKVYNDTSTPPTGRIRRSNTALMEDSDDEWLSPRRRTSLSTSSKSKKTRAVCDSSDESSKASKAQVVSSKTKAVSTRKKQFSPIDDILEDSESDYDVTFLQTKRTKQDSWKSSLPKAKPKVAQTTNNKQSSQFSSLEDRLWDDDLDMDITDDPPKAATVTKKKQASSQRSATTVLRKTEAARGMADHSKHGKRKKRKSSYGARAEAKRRSDAIPSHVGGRKSEMHAYRLDHDESDDDDLSRATSVDRRAPEAKSQERSPSFSLKRRGKKAPPQNKAQPRQSVFNPSRLESASSNGYGQDAGDSSSGDEENDINGKRQCILGARGARNRMVREGSVADSSIRTADSSVASLSNEHRGSTALNRMSNQHIKKQTSTTKKSRMSVEGNKRKPGGVMQLELISRSSKSRGIEEDSQDSFF